MGVALLCSTIDAWSVAAAQDLLRKRTECTAAYRRGIKGRARLRDTSVAHSNMTHVTLWSARAPCTCMCMCLMADTRGLRLWGAEVGCVPFHTRDAGAREDSSVEKHADEQSL